MSGLAGSLYSAIKGDLVDELLAKYINMTQCPVPIKRLGNGYYLFGTKKIFAKIMNGKLVIRVGGGFMVIEEFIAAYADTELKKLQSAEGATAEDESGKSKGYGSNRKSPRGLQSASPREAFGKKVLKWLYIIYTLKEIKLSKTKCWSLLWPVSTCPYGSSYQHDVAYPWWYVF